VVRKLKFSEVEAPEVVRLDFGPGPCDTQRGIGEYKAGSVDEIHANYVLQYMTPAQRKAFVNLAHKALKPGGTLVVIVPHWAAHKAYQDIDVQWPPVVEGWFQVLERPWRDAQPIKQVGYDCNFSFTLGYGMHQSLLSRNQEYQHHALTFWKEAAQDIHCTLTKL
jgi:hypothetical protein